MHEKCSFSNKITLNWICGKCQIARRAWFWHVASQMSSNLICKCLTLYEKRPILFFCIYLQPVSQVKVNGTSDTTGVVLQDGTEINSNIVLSNATPKVTYLNLVEKVRISKSRI